MKHIELLNKDIESLDSYTTVPCCNECNSDCSINSPGCNCDSYIPSCSCQLQ